MRTWLIVAMLGLGACGWEHRVNKLSDVEFDHYYALKPFMSDEARKEYLKLKTEEERNKWLQDKGLWDRFYKYEEHLRKAIVNGAVQQGWTKDMVLMAWGAPYDKRVLAGRPAPKSELLLYRFEKHEDGTVIVWVPGSKTEYKAVDRFRREVILDNDVVTEIVEKPGWTGQ
ncbi:MAG: hypothetical protein ACOZNI_29690 [Myxococcota bacterium]